MRTESQLHTVAEEWQRHLPVSDGAVDDAVAVGRGILAGAEGCVWEERRPLGVDIVRLAVAHEGKKHGAFLMCMM